MSRIGYRLRVYGDVQGVDYRQYAQLQAEKLGLGGLVRNNDDGSVTIEVEGKPTAVERFRHWCEKGSPWAQVVKIQAQAIQPQNLSDFTIY